MADATVTFSLLDVLGLPFEARRSKVWIEFNTDDGWVVDEDGNVRMDAGSAVVDDTGLVTLAGIPVPSGTTNPTDWQVKIHYDVPVTLPGSRGKTRKRDDFGWMTITADADLTDLIAEQYVPPTWLSTAISALQGMIDDAGDDFDVKLASAEDLLDAQVALSGISSTDSAVAGLVGNNALGPLTRAALRTLIAGDIANPSSTVGIALSASIAQQAPKIARPGLKVLVDGDSIAAQCPTDAAADAAGTYDAYSWVEWANLSLHGRLSITANKGIGGQRSDQVLARIADSLDEDYDVAFLSVGTNDLYDGTGTTLATMKANITAIYQAHLNNGKQVVHLTPGPSVFATAPTLANHYDLMRYLRDYARDHAGIHLVESYSEAADPTDGKPLLNYCKPGDDPTNHRGVHPGYVWAARIGKAVANVVEPLAARIPVVESPSNADPRNVLTNGRMLGNTGGLATGYTVVKAADGTTATYTATKTARPDGRPGEVQQIVIPSVTWAAEQPQLFIQDTAPGGRWNVGDTVRLVVHLETDPDTAGSYPTASTLTFWNGLGALGSVGKRSADTTGGNALPAGVDVLPRRGVLRTTWGVIPTGTGRLQARVSLPYGTTRILSVEIQKAA